MSDRATGEAPVMCVAPAGVAHDAHERLEYAAPQVNRPTDVCSTRIAWERMTHKSSLSCASCVDLCAPRHTSQATCLAAVTSSKEPRVRHVRRSRAALTSRGHTQREGYSW